MRSERVDLYRDNDHPRKWRWRYVAANGRILADSGQGYHNRADAIRGLRLVTGGSFQDYPYGPELHRHSQLIEVRVIDDARR